MRCNGTSYICCFAGCQSPERTRMNELELTKKLHFLIQCLQEEMPEYAEYALPGSYAQSFDLYRALCNVRMPSGETGHTLPEEFYAVQREVLQSITKEKGITGAADLAPSETDPRLVLWQGDITTLRADAIVNAANAQMLGCFSPLHGCIDNIIHTMAGTELREKCYRIMKRQQQVHGGDDQQPTAVPMITPAYNLPVKYVVHVVGPIVSPYLKQEHREQLAACYRNCLDLAAEYGCENIAFCCISTGVFMFPQDKAAEIAVKTVKEWLDAHPGSCLKKVIFNVFKDSDLRIYQKLLVTSDSRVSKRIMGR